MKKKFCVAFVEMRDDQGWIGGTNYIRNLLQAICTLKDRKITTVLMLAPRAAVPEGFAVDRVVRSDFALRRSALRIMGKLSERLFRRNYLLERLLTRQGITILSHCSTIGNSGKVPVIGWIPDFQERHLPQFFSEAECARRAAEQAIMARDARCVIVSSESVRRDAIDFLPEVATKVRVLQFVAGIETVNTRPENELRQVYDLAGPFFYIPNQFWVHKNHGVVVDSLSILADRGVDATVICTGNTHDYRNPKYFAHLMQHAEIKGVTDRFRVAGMVPYRDVAGFMDLCVAVINPSVFEGWSTSVEEAKSRGKLVLLSDIEVHREQTPERGTYFSPDDAIALADAMEHALIGFDPAAEAVYVEAAGRALPGRIKSFAETYEKIVLEAISSLRD